MEFWGQKEANTKRNWRTCSLLLSSSLWRQKWCSPRDWRHDDTPCYPPPCFTLRLLPVATRTQPRLRENTPGWRGWQRRLYETKLGQADSRQAESGRGSRVVQAFSARSSPLETTLKPVVASPLRRYSILKPELAPKRISVPCWDREVELLGREEDLEKKQAGLSEYGEVCING